MKKSKIVIAAGAFIALTLFLGIQKDDTKMYEKQKMFSSSTEILEHLNDKTIRTYNIANDYFSITATTPGPRTFEAALAGAAQIYISNGMEIENYYDINTEIVLSHDVREVADIINQGLSSRNYLDIAKAAQDRTIEEHLYTERVKAMFKLMREIF